MRAESQQENESMLEAIRELNKELQLQSLIMDRYIPEDYQTQLEAHSTWSEDTGEWHMVREYLYSGYMCNLCDLFLCFV